MPLYRVISKARSPLVRKVIAEAVGTFLLTCAISAANGEMAPIYIGFVLVVLVFAFGFISGGQYNPAVSLALMLIGAQTVVETVVISVTQLVCALLGCIAGSTIFARTRSSADLAITVPGNGFTVVECFFAEVVFTTLLIVVLLHVAASEQAGNHFFGLCIGGAVLAGAGIAGPVSGGSFNPAVSTGLHLTKIIFGYTDSIHFLWIYWVSGPLAALISAFIFLLLNDSPIKVADSFESNALIQEDSVRNSYS